MLVTMSASYGAAGSRIGPALAQRLGVPFIDRAIPLAVAEELDVPIGEAAAYDGQLGTGSWLDRILRGFIGTDASAPSPLPADAVSSEDFQRTTEQLLLQEAQNGDGVILGRGGAAVLREDPRVLRVRLDGPAQARIQQALQLGVADRETAERALHKTDRAHAEYMRRFYGVEIDDPSLYHLMLDSTRFDIDTCVDILARAAQALKTGLAARFSTPN